MKVNLISDLHIAHHYPWETIPQADAVVIAGDVSNGYIEDDIYEIASNIRDRKVIVVFGNHDYYNLKDYKFTINSIETDNPNVTVLDNSSIELEDMIVFGGTMWSSLDAYGTTTRDYMQIWYQNSIRDFESIPGWDSDLMIQAHEKFVQDLKAFEESTRDSQKKRVVVTHFAPSLRSVHAMYYSQIPYNSYWCNNLPEDLISKFDFWMHGHVHNSFDYQIGRCRVVCNPRGYSHGGILENSSFNPDLIFDIK